MKTILVPTDFSETANNALEVAAQLVKKFKAKLIVLHMLEVPSHLLPDAGLSNDVSSGQNTNRDDMQSAMFYMMLTKKRFQEMAELPYLKDVEYEEKIQNHHNFAGIIDSAHKFNADLIVMGSHGTSGLKEFFVGSNTEKVVRNSDIPVLVIKSKNENFDVKNVVFATNWDAENARPFVQAYQLCQNLGAKMHLLYVNTSGIEFLTSKEITEKFVNLISQANVRSEDITSNTYSDKTIEKGILNFSKENNIDLIAIPTHGRRGLDHFINRSIGEEIVNHAQIPVITFKIS